MNFKHGDTNTRLHNIWKTLKARCLTKTSKGYPNYGAKGITIYSEWLDYLIFKRWALEAGYTDKLTIHRINHLGNYEPLNCVWLEKSIHTSLDNKRKAKLNHVQHQELVHYHSLGITKEILSKRFSICKSSVVNYLRRAI